MDSVVEIIYELLKYFPKTEFRVKVYLLPKLPLTSVTIQRESAT
jgi:hypothetical protein